MGHVAPPIRRRILRIGGIVLASLLGLVSLAVAGAVFFLQGERMGAFVAKVLPEMRGKLSFAPFTGRRVCWSTSWSNAPLHFPSMA